MPVVAIAGLVSRRLGERRSHQPRSCAPLRAPDVRCDVRVRAGAYSKLVAAAGGDDNAFTSPDETVYVAEVPPAVYPEVIRREGDRMRHLAITQANLDKEKKIVTEELRLRGENDPLAGC
jgi:predicted Zn-dependent peptidase